jgi:hypothetical protein
MIRRFALAIPLLVAMAAPAFGQVHPTHAGMPPHAAGTHTAADSATHAALHALFMSNWTGKVTTPHGPMDPATWSFEHDSLHQVRIDMRAEDHTVGGIARDFLVRGDAIRWTQELPSSSCKVTAVLKASEGTLKGSMICEQGDITFALKKATK